MGLGERSPSPRRAPAAARGRVGVVLGAALAVASSLVPAPPARAAVWTFTDAEGVVHLSNRRPRVAAAQGLAVDSDVDRVVARLRRREQGRYDALIAEAAMYYTLPPALIRAVVAVESGFDPGAVSANGARGLMQLMPATAAAMGVDDPSDPSDGLFGGARYLRLLVNQFDGDVVRAVAAYHAGPAAVLSANGVPGFAATEAYVARVMALWEVYAALPLSGQPADAWPCGAPPCAAGGPDGAAPSPPAWAKPDAAVDGAADAGSAR